MSAAATTALVLQCFFNRPTDGSVPADSIPAMNVPVAGAIAVSLVAGQPPVSATAFEGEASALREWRFAGTRDPAATSFTALRVSLSQNAALPSPFAARLGTVAVAADRRSRFQERMTGWCKLNPADGAPK